MYESQRHNGRQTIAGLRRRHVLPRHLRPATPPCLATLPAGDNERFSVTVQDPPRPFPGFLYAGNGMRLAGDGPDAFTDTHGETLPFKTILRTTPVQPGEVPELQIGDRLWVLPDSFGSPPEVPVQLLFELADVIRGGGQVGLMARDEVEGARMRDMLVLLLSPPAGQA